MTQKDLFNAINDIDPRYITDAFESTEDPAEPEEISIGGEKTPRHKIFGVAAAFAALAAVICLAVYIRVQYPKNDLITSGSNAASQSDPLALSDKRLPISIQGPDLAFIKYGDIAGVLKPDGNIVKAEEFDPDNWDTITITDFTYLAHTTYTSCNSIKITPELTGLPDKKDYSSSPDRRLGYKRFRKGDKYGPLTVKDTLTQFKLDRELVRLDNCYAAFDGSVKVSAYIFRKENDSMLYCVQMTGEQKLPVMAFSYDSASNSYVSPSFIGSSASGEFKYNTEYPAITLKNTEADDFEDIFNGKDYAAVTLTLSDISMACEPAGRTFILADASEVAAAALPDDDPPFELIGADGAQIKHKDVKHFFTTDGSVEYYSNLLTADNWKKIYCEGFGYIASSTGSSFNSLDDPEMFDPDGSFKGAAGTDREFVRINCGDKFGDLTVNSASVTFERTEGGAGEITASLINFDGRVTIDAYIVREAETDLVYLIPLNGEKQLPIGFPNSSRNEGICPEGGFSYSTDLPKITLNKHDIFIWDYYIGAGECKRVNITLENIELKYGIAPLTDGIDATIVRIND